ncbi:NUDIX domain-containing protein [Martelella soudanensis]|uniref:NUDIX domain-containing protein n=1 Tax=unclassified Martelella TaxID=2629616 RepID=UPI0015DE1EDA|nr:MULTISPECIES: NUDIX hydrolase [unclassified Martelella]
MTTNRVKILEKNTLFEGWSRIVEYVFRYRDSKGSESERSWEVCERPEAACVLVYDRDLGKFVLVRQFRVPVYAMGGRDGFLLELAAGLIDDGETPEEAAIREAREETGYAVGDLVPVTAMISAPGILTEIVHCFAAVADSSMRVDDGGGLSDEHEDIEIVTLTLDEAMAMVTSGDISDAKTIIMLQWAAMNRSVFGL